MKITLALCGSSAIWKACSLIEHLRLEVEDIEITVVMTEMATKFIQPLMLQTLTGRTVYTCLENEDNPSKVRHIQLAQKTDLFLVVPMTANTLAKIANGIADDMVSTVALAVPGEVKKIVVPAMNQVMYESIVVQENLHAIKQRGYQEIPPQVGILSSGAKGIGVLAEIDAIVKQIIEMKR